MADGPSPVILTKHEISSSSGSGMASLFVSVGNGDDEEVEADKDLPEEPGREVSAISDDILFSDCGDEGICEGLRSGVCDSGMGRIAGGIGEMGGEDMGE